MTEAKAEARLAQRIAHRWLYWEPFVLRFWKLNDCASSAFAYSDFIVRTTEAYKTQINLCLQLGLPWTTITYWKLDDPLLPPEKFRFNLNAAVERRRQAKEKHVANRSRNRL